MKYKKDRWYHRWFRQEKLTRLEDLRQLIVLLLGIAVVVCFIIYIFVATVVFTLNWIF